jgi:hypothetical protein
MTRLQPLHVHRMPKPMPNSQTPKRSHRHRDRRTRRTAKQQMEM